MPSMFTLPFPIVEIPSDILPHPWWAIQGTGGDDEMFADYSTGSYLVGNAGDDRLVGFQGDDTLYGGSGHDHMDGGDGDDYMHGGSGNDNIDGDQGRDTIIGGAGEDTIFGDYVGEWNPELRYDDLINAGADNDYIWGGYGNDTIRGGTGTDHLFGEQGNDLLIGGAGETGGDGSTDYFVFSEGTDTILDYEVGIDEIRLQGGLSLSSASVSYGSFSYSDGRSESGLIIDFGHGDVLQIVGITSETDITWS